MTGQAEPREDLVWRPESWREIYGRPLPFQAASFLNRFICRAVLMLFQGRVKEIRGLQHILPGQDPFVFACNHNQKPEAVILPTLLVYLRSGKLIHFLSDWNFQLIPVVRTVIRRSQVITMTTKSAKPRFLNLLKPLFEQRSPALVRARKKLEAGAPVGAFVEGTVNRDPVTLLPGHPGAARLSLETGSPVVPAGIVFPDHPKNRPILDRDRMVLHIGSPLFPAAPARPGRPSPEEVRAWHDRIMLEISRLSGKAVAARAPRR